MRFVRFVRLFGQQRATLALAGHPDKLSQGRIRTIDAPNALVRGRLPPDQGIVRSRPPGASNAVVIFHRPNPASLNRLRNSFSAARVQPSGRSSQRLGERPGDVEGEAVPDLATRHPGTKRYHHPLVGDLTITFEAFIPPGDPDQAVFVYSTEPGSPSGTSLALLAEWSEGVIRVVR